MRSQGGTMVLRIEDLDLDRCTLAKAEQVDNYLGLPGRTGAQLLQ